MASAAEDLAILPKPQRIVGRTTEEATLRGVRFVTWILGIGRLGACWFALSFAMGCASYGVPLAEIATEVNATLYTGPTLIQPGDKLALEFPNKTDWNHIGNVNLDGEMVFPVLGTLRVAGLNMAELNAELKRRYDATDAQPECYVSLGNAEQQGGSDQTRSVTVTGEVRTPGLVALRGERLTLIEALGRAGGHAKATALLGNTLLLRRSRVAGTYRAWRIDARVEHWGTADPIYLQPHDLIYVPNTPVDNVNIWIDKYIRQNVPIQGLIPFALGIAVR